MEKNCNHIPKLRVGQYLLLFSICYYPIPAFVTISYYFTDLQ